MDTISHKITGDLRVNCDTQLLGMVTGSVTVEAPNTFILLGMVGKDLIAEQNSVVIINGMVAGTVINKGADLKINGVVGGLQEN